MSIKKKMYLFEDSDRLDQLISCKYPTKNQRILRAKYLYVLSKGIVKLTHRRKEYSEKGFRLRIQAGNNQSETYSTANIGSLQFLFGGSPTAIKKIIDDLVEWGYIKIHLQYRVGVQARSYKFTSEYENKKITVRWFNVKDAKFFQRWHCMWMDYLQDPVYSATQINLKSHVSVNKQGLRYLREKYAKVPIVQHIVEAHELGILDDNKEALRNKLSEIALEQEDILLLVFVMGEAEVFPKGKSRRLYHSFCNLRREFRPFIHLQGQPLLETDLVNSQPIFSVALIKRTLNEKFCGYDATNLDFYEKCCVDGIFYETIAKQAGIDISDNAKRKNFKQLFFQQVFFGRLSIRNSKILKAFIDLFPTAWNAIAKIKEINYQQFALELQNLESEVMIYDVYYQLIQEGHRVLPLHDAIYSSDVNAQKRAEILIREAFTKKFGLKVTLVSTRVLFESNPLKYCNVIDIKSLNSKIGDAKSTDHFPLQKAFNIWQDCEQRVGVGVTDPQELYNRMRNDLLCGLYYSNSEEEELEKYLRTYLSQVIDQKTCVKGRVAA